MANITVGIFKQRSSIDAKISGPKYDDKQDICIISKYFPTG